MPHTVLRAALVVALAATLPPPALAAAPRAPLPATEPEPPPRRPARPPHHAVPTPTPSATATAAAAAAAGRRVMSEREKTCRTVNRCAMDADTPCPPCGG